MNILIENEETLEFLTESGGWTKDPRAGRQFKSRGDATSVAKGVAIGRFNIVWHILTSNQFVNLDHGRGKGVAEPSPA